MEGLQQGLEFLGGDFFTDGTEYYFGKKIERCVRYGFATDSDQTDEQITQAIKQSMPYYHEIFGTITDEFVLDKPYDICQNVPVPATVIYTDEQYELIHCWLSGEMPPKEEL